jgi:predicted MFS family arabinose efflux permease
MSRWSVVVGFSLVGAATQLVWLNFAGVTTVAAAHYGVSENAVGWLAQVFPLLYVVLAIPAGMVLDRWFRGGLYVGAYLTAIGAGIRLGGGGDHFELVVAGQIVAAIGQPLVLNAIPGVAKGYLAARDRPAGIAVCTASTFAGMVLAFALSAVFPAEDQLRTLLIVSAVFALAAAITLEVTLSKPILEAHRTRSALRLAWGDGFIRWVCLLVFLPFGTFVGLSTFAQALLEPAGVSGSTASVILLGTVVAGVAGCAVVPVVASRRRVELPVCAIALGVTALCCLALAVAPGVAVGFVALAVLGAVLLPTMPIVLTLVERHTGEAEGTASGLVWLAGNLGGLVVAAAVGLLVDQPTLAFLLTGVAALAALPLLLPLRRYLRAEVAARPVSRC